MPENPNTRVDNTRKLQTVTERYRIAQAFHTSNSEATSLPGHMHVVQPSGDGEPAAGLRPKTMAPAVAHAVVQDGAFKVAQVGQISDVKLAHPVAVQTQRHSAGNSK